MSESPNRVLGIFLGTIYLIVGMFGFFVTNNTPFASTVGSRLLGIFELNPLQNLLHLAAGIALLLCGLVGPRTSKVANGLVGLAFLGLGGIGLLIASGSNPLNILALNGGDNVLDFATAVVLLAVAVGADKLAREPKTT